MENKRRYPRYDAIVLSQNPFRNLGPLGTSPYDISGLACECLSHSGSTSTLTQFSRRILQWLVIWC